MMRVKTIVKESPLHGLGVYADEFIPKDTIVWEFNPLIDTVISQKQLDALPDINQKYILHYTYKTEERYVFCGDDGKYFNHSATPNTVGKESPDGYGVSRASGDIQKGEELTCDYEDTDDNYDDKLKENEFVQV